MLTDTAVQWKATFDHRSRSSFKSSLDRSTRNYDATVFPDFANTNKVILISPHLLRSGPSTIRIRNDALQRDAYADPTKKRRVCRPTKHCSQSVPYSSGFNFAKNLQLQRAQPSRHTGKPLTDMILVHPAKHGRRVSEQRRLLLPA